MGLPVTEAHLAPCALEQNTEHIAEHEQPKHIAIRNAVIFSLSQTLAPVFHGIASCLLLLYNITGKSTLLLQFSPHSEMFIFYSHFYTKQVTFVKNLAEKQKIQRLTYVEPCRGG